MNLIEENQSDSKQSDAPITKKNQHLRNLRIHFCLYAVSVAVVFGSFGTMTSLQSSINIEDGLGNQTVMTTFASAILCALLATPLLVTVLGPKYALILSDFCFLVFVASNAYPALYTVIPGGIFCGIAAATMWPCTSLFNVYFGLEHSKCARKNDNVYVQLYTAYFFGVFQFNQVIGNALTTITFKISENHTKDDILSDFANVTDWYGVTTQKPQRDVSVCGSHDCQDPNATTQNLQQYNPATEEALYILTGVLSILILISITVKFIFLPKISSTVQLLPNSYVSSGTIQTPEQKGKITESKEKMPKSVFYINSTFDVDCGTQKRESTCIENESDQKEEDAGSKIIDDNSNESTWDYFCKTLKSTAVHVCSKQQLLVAELTVYDGLVISFASSELTRAYASCVIGVPQVGLGMITYGLGDIIVSFIVGKTSTSGGLARNIPFIVAFALDIISYSCCLIWEPNTEKSWVIYFFFFGFGCADGIWQTLLNFRYAEYFPKRQDIAFTVWNMWIMLGVFIEYTISSYMCVYEKIYMHLSILVVAIILYGIGEYRFLHSRHATEIDD